MLYILFDDHRCERVYISRSWLLFLIQWIDLKHVVLEIVKVTRAICMTQCSNWTGGQTGILGGWILWMKIKESGGRGSNGDSGWWNHQLGAMTVFTVSWLGGDECQCRSNIISITVQHPFMSEHVGGWIILLTDDKAQPPYLENWFYFISNSWNALQDEY